MHVAYHRNTMKCCRYENSEWMLRQMCIQFFGSTVTWKLLWNHRGTNWMGWIWLLRVLKSFWKTIDCHFWAIYWCVSNEEKTKIEM